jgi:hypothetical protein
MPKMVASKEDLQGQPAIPEGLYDVQLRGFKPAKSKDGKSTNLNPDIRVINHPTLNDRRIFVSMNTNAVWLWTEICHCFGCPLEEDTASGEFSIPGSFDGPETDPAKWVYTGPLLQQQGKLYAIQREYKGRIQNDVKQYVCRVAGCQEKHNDNLVKA